MTRYEKLRLAKAGDRLWYRGACGQFPAGFFVGWMTDGRLVLDEISPFSSTEKSGKISIISSADYLASLRIENPEPAMIATPWGVMAA